jgi:hypothetical protein
LVSRPRASSAKRGPPHPAPRPKRIPLAKRLELLKYLDRSHELDGACLLAGVSEEAVRADAKLMAEVAEAFRRASSRLREKAVGIALESKNAGLLDRILNHRSEELARLKASAPQPEAPATTPKDDFLEQIAKIFERQILNDPPKWLRAILGSVLSDGVVKLNAEAKAAAQRLHEILEGHPPAPYTEAWWALERAAGRNGSTGFAGYGGPARPGPAEPPTCSEERVKRAGMIDPTTPIPPGQALVPVVRKRVPPAPPEVMEQWYGPAWADSPWSW